MSNNKDNMENDLQEIAESLEKEVEILKEEVTADPEVMITEEKEEKEEKVEEKKEEKTETTEAEDKKQEKVAEKQEDKKQEKEPQAQEEKQDDKAASEEEEEKSTENTEQQQKTEEKKPFSKGLALKIGGIVVGVLLVIYLGAALYFQGHFYIGTSMNGLVFSGKTVETAGALLEETAGDYVLTLKGRDGLSETISGTAIDLKHDNRKDLEVAMENQNAFLWIGSLFSNQNKEVPLKVTYDEDKLEVILKDLAAFDTSKQTAPVSAIPVYNGTEYEIQKEQQGAMVATDALRQAIIESLGSLQTELDLEQADCYVKPTYTTTSEEVIAAKDNANQWLSASITYTIDEEQIVVDREQITKWIKFDEKTMKVSLAGKKIKSYIGELADTYNTVGKKFEIKTPTGKVAKVSGGTYGMKIDESGEYKKLVEQIKAGKVTTRKPKYSQTIAGTTKEPWGKTYLEVDLTEQHMWYIKEGKVSFESDVVTGVPIPAKHTPQGVYSVLEKLRNKVLRGEIQANGKPEYVTPVSYWMRVTWTGIGFHDATWQRKFGGERYKQGYGSHGCINMPLSGIKELYDMVDKGCPIVIHN